VLDARQLRIQVGLMIAQKVHAASGQWRHYDVNLVVLAHMNHISHEITEFAISSCFFKAQFGEPVAAHTDGEVGFRIVSFEKIYKMIPLFTMHYLAYSSSNLVFLS